jgi:hypothetical protein
MSPKMILPERPGEEGDGGGMSQLLVWGEGTRRRASLPIDRTVLALSSHASVGNGTFNLDFESTVQQRRAIWTERLTIIWIKICQKNKGF